jgi:Reverse transcriptase (RNA-dependent DNA polymerase)
VFASNESYDTEILLFASQINYVPPTKANNCPFELEVIFCVQGTLSPLLSNIVLDELDWELERRGHRFVRYADDSNIFVRSARAGERVMASIRHFLERRMRLKVNEEKSGIRFTVDCGRFMGRAEASQRPPRPGCVPAVALSTLRVRHGFVGNER